MEIGAQTGRRSCSAFPTLLSWPPIPSASWDAQSIVWATAVPLNRAFRVRVPVLRARPPRCSDPRIAWDQPLNTCPTSALLPLRVARDRLPANPNRTCR